MSLADLMTQIDVATPKLPPGKVQEPAHRPGGESDYRSALTKSLAKDSRTSESAPPRESKPAKTPERKPTQAEPSTAPAGRGETAEQAHRSQQPRQADKPEPPTDESLAGEVSTAASQTAQRDEADADVTVFETAVETVVQAPPVEINVPTRTDALIPPAGLQFAVSSETAEPSLQAAEETIPAANQTKPVPPPNFLQANVVDTNLQPADTDAAASDSIAVAQSTVEIDSTEVFPESADPVPAVDASIPGEHEIPAEKPSVETPQHEVADASVPVDGIDASQSVDTTKNPTSNPLETSSETEENVDSAPTQQSPVEITAEDPSGERGADSSPQSNSETSPPAQAFEANSTDGAVATPPQPTSQTTPESERSTGEAAQPADTSEENAVSTNSPRGEGAVPIASRTDAGTTADAKLGGEGESQVDAIEPPARSDSAATQPGVRIDGGSRANEPTAGTPSSGEAPVDPSRPESADRVARMVQSSLRTGRPLRVRLSPPELGTLQIEVASRSGAVTARLDVQSPAARQVVLDNLSSLQESLAQQGTPIDHIEVHLSDFSSEDRSAESFAEWDQQAEQQASHDGQREQGEQHEPERDEPAPAVRPAGNESDRIDVQI